MPNHFLGVYTAIYDYVSQNEKELSLREGDILCVLEKPPDDDWWRAKRKGNSLSDDEPIGLIPNNYIEEAHPFAKYRALYGYERQTEEELTFDVDAILDAFDISDSDWALVGFGGNFGFAPANYIERVKGSNEVDTTEAISRSSIDGDENVSRRSSCVQASERDLVSSAATLPPNKLRSPTVTSSSSAALPGSSKERNPSLQNDKPVTVRSVPKGNTTNYSDSEESDGPSLPQRRPGQPPYRHPDARKSDPPIPPGFWTFPVQEVDSKKKRAATLGLGSATVILLPDKSSRPKEEWKIDNLTGYNYEGKHVFLEFEKPSRSLDLHAGSTNAAEEIVAGLGEMRGVRKASGLDEVIAAATSTKINDIGTVLFDFPAQGHDEVSVTTGDEVIILDDKNEDWWLVRRQVNGIEGVVPRKYVERGRTPIKIGIMGSPGHPRNIVTNHVRLSSAATDIGHHGVPERRSSLPPQGRKSAPPRSKPDQTQLRTWADRLGKFEVEAQFLGYRDDKIHLHKANGVKIAVPVSKMSMKDIKFVEDKTGVSLEDQKPLSEIMKRQRPQPGITVDRSASRDSVSTKSAGIPSQCRKDEYDWFDFFLGCGVDVHDCQRYTINFQKDNMDESILSDITPEIMRTLGMKEGDILRVRKKLEKQHEVRNDSGGLFSELNGTLKSKTTRSRPPPPIQPGASVDANAFSNERTKIPKLLTASSQTPPPLKKHNSGFEDEAWQPKTLSEQAAPVKASDSKASATEQKDNTNTSLQDIGSLSFSTPPLQPTLKTPPPMPQADAVSHSQQQLSFVPPSQPTNIARSRPIPPTITSPGALGILPPISRPMVVKSFTGSSTPNIGSPLPPVSNYPSLPQMGLSAIQNTTSLTGGQSMTTPPMLYSNGESNFPLPGFQPVLQQNISAIPSTGYQPNINPLNTGVVIPNFPTAQIPMMQNLTLSTQGPLHSQPLMHQQTGILGITPLQVQPTGPPPVRFGVQGPKKLVAQPTGKADLSKASPSNPFGF